MPLEKPEDFGTNADGSANGDYCRYCYAGGAFTSDETMEGMIEACIPFTLEAGAFGSADEARAAMAAEFPKLKRWATA
ncbi:MAG: zinc ribbon domain-containing protein [Firmicutes bacterium]|nr:zinc ribbon domain-containing protein [Bacillota bacterium]